MANPVQHANPGAKPWAQPGSTPVISYTPTDIAIPQSLYAKVPNLDLYKKLLEAERKLDLLTTRKTLEFQKSQAKSAHPSMYDRKHGTLRVFVYNTTANQPWQKQLALAQLGNSVPSTTINDPSDSTWTLRVEGKYLGEPKTGKSTNDPFSSFLAAISIDLVPNEDYPNLKEATNNVIEWRNPTLEQQQDPNKPPSGSTTINEFDGVDIKRNGIHKLTANIAILPKSVWSQLKLSPSMAQFYGREESTQQELLFAVWQYVLHKGLLKKGNSFQTVPAVTVAGSSGNLIDEGGDFSVVQCDEVLLKLLNVGSFKFSELYKLVQPHFQPREPIRLSYEIDTSRSTTLGDLVIDIPVELPPTLLKVQEESIQSTKLIYEKLTQTDSSLLQLNNKISLGIVALKNSLAREQFYREFSEDPVNFLKEWLESLLNTLRVLKSDEGYDEESVRRSEYFVENEESLKDIINVLLGSGKI